MNVRPSQLSARLWFVFACLILIPICVFSVWREPTFAQLPKPSSDGPIYENIAFHLSVGDGFKFDLSDPQWAEPYTNNNNSEAYKTYLEAEPVSMPMTGRPPLLPMLIAVVYQAVGRGPTGFATLRVINALCLAVAGALAVANVVIVLGRRTLEQDIHRDVTKKIYLSLGCLGAIALAASNRTLLSYANDFLTEPLALLLTQLLVTCLLVSRQVLAILGTGNVNKVGSLQNCIYRGLLRKRTLLAISIAISLALMVLVRSLFILWIPGVWLLLILCSGDQQSLRARLRGATLIIAIAVLIMSPWWMRNCYVLNRPMPLGTQGPITLLGGYSDEALAKGGDWQPEPELNLRASLRSDPAYQARNDVERELMLVDESRRLVQMWIGDHFLDLPKMFMQRIITHWNPYFGRSLIWKLLILIGAVWLVVSRRSEAWILVGLPLMNTLLVALLYTTGGRFLVPLYGVLFSLAGIGMAVTLQLSVGCVHRIASRLRA